MASDPTEMTLATTCCKRRIGPMLTDMHDLRSSAEDVADEAAIAAALGAIARRPTAPASGDLREADFDRRAAAPDMAAAANRVSLAL